jgi:hypothetical protein
MGFYTRAEGEASTAMGWQTTASGDDSTAIGAYTTASGKASTAMGSSTTASGNTATAMGWQTTASGFASMAMGDHTTASGEASTAMGLGTIAGLGQLSIGVSNVNTNDGMELNSVEDWSNLKDNLAAFTIGNGEIPYNNNGEIVSASRSNAFEVMYNGDTTIGGDTTIAGKLTIGNMELTEDKLGQLLNLLTLLDASDEQKRDCLKIQYNTLSTC